MGYANLRVITQLVSVGEKQWRIAWRFYILFRVPISRHSIVSEGACAMAGGRNIGWRYTVGIALVLPALAGVAAPVGVRAGQAPASDVTFSKEIAPILQRSCQNCHRPD